MKQILFLLVFSSLLALSCKSDKSVKTNDQEETTVTKKYSLTPFSPSQSFNDAEIKSMSYENGKFNFDLAEGDYELGVQTSDADQKMCANSGKGQHIHLIVGDAPYAAKYTNEFNHDIEDGEHYLLAFLSRSYHESIKTEKAHVAKKVSVKDKGITEAAPIEESMLFYSRPKGTYSGKAETDKVMLDFYPVNADIGKTHKIIALINGEEHEITKWQPYYIEGLPLGENSITLSLVDMDGGKVKAPHNPVTRKFSLRGDTAQE